MSVLAVIAAAYWCARDLQRGVFVSLCAVTFLPAAVGWYLLVPVCGAVLLLSANVAYARWRKDLVPHTSLFVVLSVALICGAVATFQTLHPTTQLPNTSLEWRELPGQSLGLRGMVTIVVIASITNAVFEELLWRVGFERLFTGGRLLFVRWLLLSALFGLAHIQGTPGGAAGMAFAGLFGLAMCLVRYLSRGSAAWIVLTHFVADVILIGGLYADVAS